MRLRTRAPLVVFAIALAALIFACGDLFHATDFETRCDLDANAMGCGTVVASKDASSAIDANRATTTSVCAPDHATARAWATHSCAWLGACAGPLGNNAFGACMVDALFAYDCAANPSLGVAGDTAAYWLCLANATTCDAIDDCVDIVGAVACQPTGPSYSACERDAVDGGAHTRVYCPGDGGMLVAENCIGHGQTCNDVASGKSLCEANVSTPTCATGCANKRILHDCTDDPGAGPIDLGVDCANYGAQTCVAIGGGSGACYPNGAATCNDGPAVTCSDAGVATSCATGIEEQVDCAALFDAGTCSANVAGTVNDVRRACAIPGADCSDSCNRGTVTSCANGITFSVDCASLGLGACTTMTLEGQVRASCTR